MDITDIVGIYFTCAHFSRLRLNIFSLCWSQGSLLELGSSLESGSVSWPLDALIAMCKR